MPKIMIDAGHYGNNYNAGAVKGYYESNMAWELHNYLKDELKSYGFEVATTRSDKNKDLEVYQRGKKAKGYDLFISLHSNGASSAAAKRVSVFHPISGKGKEIAQILADVIFETMNLTKDKNWYSTVNTRAYSESKPTTDYYGVIRGAVAAGSIGIILEHSFHTNKEACKWLMQSANLQKLAKAEAKALANYYGLTQKTTNDGIEIGDIVTFTGTKHYTSSGKLAIGKSCKAGKAKVVDYIKGKTHPYLLLKTANGGSTVNGWVNESDIAEIKTAYKPKVGDVVMLTPNATVYGKTTKFSPWVYKSKLYVREVDGSRVVVSTQKKGAVTGSVDKKYIVQV